MAYNSSKGTFDAQHVSASNVVYSKTELVTEGNLNISGSTTLGDNAADIITVTGQLTGSQGAYFADRVGVGVATPDSALEVAGNVHLSSETTTPSTPAAADGGVMYVKADGNLYWLSDDVAEVSLSSGGGISFNGSTANGVVTYGGATQADVEANMTFNGSQLSVTGIMSASSAVKGSNIVAGGANVISEGRLIQNVLGATIGGPLTATGYISGSTDATFVGNVVTEGSLSVTGSSTFSGIATHEAHPIFETGITIKNADASAGYINFYEQSSNGTNVCTFRGKSSMGNCTITLPGDTGTVVLEDNTVTLSNKTISAPTLTGVPTAAAITSSAAVTAHQLTSSQGAFKVNEAGALSGSGATFHDITMDYFTVSEVGIVSGSGALKGMNLVVGGANVISKGRLIQNVLGATIGGTLTTTGDVTLGDAASDATTATGRLTGSQGAYFAGRVGISQNAPAYELDLSGSLHLNGNLGAPTAPAATEGGVLFGSGSGTLYWASTEQLSRDISNQVFHKPQGCNFSFGSVSTVSLTPGGLDGNARVSLYKDTTKHMMEYVLTASITADISESGFNGLDTGAEAADTGYYMYVICKDQGLLPGMLFSTSNINPTMPSGYTYRSAPIWFASNDGSSNLLDFNQRGCNGTCYYNNFQNVIDNGQQLEASGWAAVDMSDFIPADSEAVLLMRISGDVTAGSTTLRLTTDSAAAPASAVGTYFVNRLSSNGEVATTTWFNWGLSNSATGLYYAWTADPGSADQGLRIDVAGFKMW